MSSLLGLLGSAAFALVAVYLASLVTVCHGPCGNKKDDVLYEMRSAVCCSPSVQDCGNFLPGQGSTWLQGICSPPRPTFATGLNPRASSTAVRLRGTLRTRWTTRWTIFSAAKGRASKGGVGTSV